MIKQVLLSLGFVAAVAFAQDAAPAEAAANDATLVADSAVVSEVVSASATVESELKEEIAIRDSVMAVQSESCSAEKDSLRKSLEIEQAKSANWEKSYETIKNDNALCAQALSVSLGVNEKKKEKEQEDRAMSSAMTTSAFLGGLGIGMLIFYLIFGTGGK